ncbi:endogenous retrovirus group k member 25 pol [Limosa lapponica baueri]|uniref:Endogenous retrovirus group k member 25 pol n=1 Tax=Limosa lapponica baueri TaxID=1758121 RepID=A0A2I0TLQ8_LIMLA|nr:endogenous retrovirus group k member 25 pol [Limosa lapponica baueri]
MTIDGASGIDTWNRLPQGWKHSHGLIQTALEKGGAPEHLQYIDDIIVWGKLVVKVCHGDAHVPMSLDTEEHRNNQQVDQADKIFRTDLDWEHTWFRWVPWDHGLDGPMTLQVIKDATYKWAHDQKGGKVHPSVWWQKHPIVTGPEAPYILGIDYFRRGYCKYPKGYQWDLGIECTLSLPMILNLEELRTPLRVERPYRENTYMLFSVYSNLKTILPWRSTVEQISTLQLVEDSTPEQVYVPKGGCDPVESP